MRETKIVIILLLSSLLVVVPFLFLIFSELEFEDYSGRSSSREIAIIDFPGGYYRLYQFRQTSVDPWTTCLELYTNITSKADIFHYVEYKMTGLNRTLARSGFSDEYLYPTGIVFKEPFPANQLKDFMDTFLAKKNAGVGVVYSDRHTNHTIAEEMWINWEQDPTNLNINRSGYNVVGIVGIHSVITTDAGRMLMSDPRILLLDTFQDEATLSIINQYNPYYIDCSPPLIWEEYAHWILLEESGS